ncbi:MAG: tRNA (guanosine(46)-N7)-methyltransferase TrmB [Rhodobacteraceae bacterium]|uniref:tRNA (guanine-N(7)-)-methyltransferase n=1 Tax=OCS116 cluster bacterium TaxID=2030921 RepID=A0A2A4YYY0_9PROT|nr:tRNA (guanosine(46)-N7)-methyltransferase TrmB [Paracoccaceae bacterium]
MDNSGSNHPNGTPWRNFYGRFRGKTIRAAQNDYLENDLAPLTLEAVSRADNPDRLPLNLATHFGGRDIWLEIGFGGGEHFVAMAAQNPDITLIGCEPFVNGVAMLLGKLRAADVANVSIHPGDVRDLFDIIADGSISKVFLNYPDPWPKTRHHRRRFVTPEHLLPLARVMKPGAELRVATDIPSYVVQTLREVPKAGFVRANLPDDQPWQDWHSTRYEQKALREGRRPHYLTFHRK